MNVTAALRWTLYYRLIAWVSALVGLGFVYLGYFLSIGGAPLDLGMAIQGAKSPMFLGPALLGFLVWQVGKTAAYYKTLTEATDQQLSERFDPELIKSDILSVLDERLSEMHSDLEATRRGVEDLETSSTENFGMDD